MSSIKTSAPPLKGPLNPMHVSDLILPDHQSLLGTLNGFIVSSLPENKPATSLPPEILDTICEHLSHTDLRALRLTSRFWQASAEKVLFAVIYLKFDRNSFERLRNIAEQPTLSRLVRYIHYDSRHLGTDFKLTRSDVHASHYLTKYWRVANAQRLVNGARSRLGYDEAVAEFHEFRSEFMAYAASQRTLLRHGSERNLLHGCVSRLPNLHSVRHSFHGTKGPLWHLPRFEGPDPVSESILGNLVRERSSEAHEHFWNLLGAACLSGAASRLREIKGSRFHLNQWINAAVPYAKSFRDFSALRVLDLEFYHSYPGLSDISTLAKLLKHVLSLQSLQLSFAAPMISHEYLKLNVSLDNIIFEGSQWNHLASLSLHAFATTESYLRNFLSAHSNSLLSLELGNAVFRHPSGVDSVKGGSWIAFFQFLNKSMRLKQVKFRQTLTNRVDETWYCPYPDCGPDRIGNIGPRLKSPDPLDCLKLRIERFITLDEPSPFEPLAEDTDLTPYFGLPWMFKTDSSWQFKADPFARDQDPDSDSL